MAICKSFLGDGLRVLVIDLVDGDTQMSVHAILLPKPSLGLYSLLALWTTENEFWYPVHDWPVNSTPNTSGVDWETRKQAPR